MTREEVQEVANIANIANKILVVNEMIKKIDDGKLETWSPVSIVVDVMGKDDVQKALLHHLDTLKYKLKEDITLL